MTAGDPSQHQIRWMPCKNVSDTTAPPYAMMTIREGEESKLAVDSSAAARKYAHEVRNGQIVWRVGSHQTPARERQFPGEIVANGPFPIPPGGYGVCTQDWPARMLVLESDAGNPSLSGGPTSSAEFLNNDISQLAIGDEIGPGWTWGLITSGSAFRVVSFDLAETRRILDDTSPHTGTYRVCWVAPGSQFVPDYAHRFLAGETLATGAAARFAIEQPNYRQRNISGTGVSGDLQQFHDTLVISQTGLYLYGFGANRFSSSYETSGFDIGLRMTRNGELSGTDATASRYTHVVPEDAYHNEGFKSAENIATSGIAPFAAGDALQIINDSFFDVSFIIGWFWLMRLGPSPGFPSEIFSG